MSKTLYPRIIFTLVTLGIFSGGFLYIRYLHAQNVQLERERDTAQENLRKIKEKAAQENEISKNLKDRHEIIESYPPEDNGSVAPVLRDVFERMRIRNGQ